MQSSTRQIKFNWILVGQKRKTNGKVAINFRIWSGFLVKNIEK